MTNAEKIKGFINSILESDAKWEMPWHTMKRAPFNVKSGNTYSGINLLTLALQSQDLNSCGQYGTFKQWKEKGYSVRKGQHGVKIVFSKEVFIEDEEGKTDSFQTYKWSTVFAREQTDAPPITDHELPDTEKREAYKAVTSYANDIAVDWSEEGSQAYFNTKTDEVKVPPFSTFKDEARFASTLAHEIGHWTMFRVERDKEDLPVHMEELVAESFSWLWCLENGVEHTEQDHTTYLKGWVSKCKDPAAALHDSFKLAAKALAYTNSIAKEVRNVNPF